ncbi:putative aspartate transaminase [Xylona heveae TC161]|uniref:Aspartate aminotransferase n=1 Tax=Xylona heveae (strain CBS 132557 / TC161) TaxID=1328760 RepID=A0A165G139_XYLHT|nr:putative aspartate transaminase [Xylona heveae TC161]KZF21617.1 putative aspartate transaminase [Xylona heveae TC161]
MTINSASGPDSYAAPAASTLDAASNPSLFSELPRYQIDSVFALIADYIADTHPEKVSLGPGVYRDDQGAPWPLNVVEKVEKQLFEKNDAGRHEYLTIAGDGTFLELARDLCFGFGEGTPEEEKLKLKIASVQTISGTGANHMGALFLSKYLKPARVWISDPTWMNHHTIWELQGVERRTYPYYHAEKRAFDFEGMMATLEEQAEKNDVILLHACAHNPTGLDPTKEQWKAIADLCERKGLFPFFDSAYQGFASGNLTEDSWSVQYFLRNKPNMEMCLAQSFSKNFGLYGQRVGAFHLVSNEPSSELRESIKVNLCHLIRGEYSMAPRGGSTIVKTVLLDEQLKKEWQNDLTIMSDRIKVMRKALYDELQRLGTPGTWEHLVTQIGMFSYTGLTAAQCHALRGKHHVYMLDSGRASITGLTSENVVYVARAFDDVVRNN